MRLLLAFLSGAVAVMQPINVVACCSFQPARFSETHGLAAEAQHNGRLVHLLGYQNTAVNMAAGGQANALFLPIPAKPGTMSRINILDTTSCPALFGDLETALPYPEDRNTSPGQQLLGITSPPPQVFEHDIYTIVLSSDPRQIPAALLKVCPERRPLLNPAICRSYAKWYKGWTFALCCFNTREQTKAKPMLWWYEPLNPDRLFFPALDAHTGNPPDLKKMVDVDHHLFFGSYKMNKGNPVKYSDASMSSELKQLLPKRIYGSRIWTQMINGDFYVDTADLHSGKYLLKRKGPPFARSAMSGHGPNRG